MSKMIVDSEIQQLSVSLRFTAYAKAYANAAAALCRQMDDEDSAKNWPNSAVVLMLAAHAVELFIKGAIHHRDPAAKVEHHRIEDLAKEYARLFPEPSFVWDIPFKIDYLGLTDAEIKTVKRIMPAPSILYRYPLNAGWQERSGVFGFEPDTFLRTLEFMQAEFKRIEALLN